MIYSAIITNGILSCGTAITPCGPEIAVPMAASCGYDAVQLTVKSAEDYDLPELKRLLKENGVFVHALATGQIYTADGLSMGSGNEENRRACVFRLCRLADVCRELDGAELIIGAVRGRTSDAETPETYHRQFEKSLGEVCRYAGKRGVGVMLELIDYLESDCCNRLPETLACIERTGCDNLQMYLDIMHLYYEKEDICAVIRQYAGTVPQIDISGENRINPMDSVIDFDTVLTALKDSGYDGVLNMEFDFSTAEDLPVKALEYVKSFF